MNQVEIKDTDAELEEGDPCPVCGWAIVDTEHIPENPDPDQGPFAPGTHFVHRIESIGNGKLSVQGCSAYENGRKDAWDPSAAEVT